MTEADSKIEDDTFNDIFKIFNRENNTVTLHAGLLSGRPAWFFAGGWHTWGFPGCIPEKTGL